MARFETFARDVALATTEISPDRIDEALADFARQELAKAIDAGEATPVYDIFVNGRKGAAEEAVKAPGPIVYQFSWWRAIVRYALDELVKGSPRKSGNFAKSFIVIVDGKPVTDFSNIEASAEVIIANSQPYVRKVQVGAMKMTVPPKVFDRARQALFRRYSQQLFSCQVMFLNISSGVDPLIPYILKGHQRARAVKATAQSSAFRAGRTTLARRKDSDAGQPLTYPSLVLNMLQ